MGDVPLNYPRVLILLNCQNLELQEFKRDFIYKHRKSGIL